VDVKSQLYGKLSGRPAIDRTVSHMRKVVEGCRKDPFIIQVARQVMTSYGVPRDDSEAEVAAIYDFLNRHVRYTKDPVDVELLQDPYVTLSMKTGDCDDISILGACLAEAIGLQARFSLFSTPGSRIPSHIYAEIKTRSGWIAVDTVLNRGVGKLPPGNNEVGAIL